MNFDLIVIGAGPGGYVCAIRAAQLGLKVACVEKDPNLGGTCLNVGCIPSKALLESSHLYYQARNDFKQHGIKYKSLNFDLKTMLQRKDDVVTQITSGVAFLFKKNKITHIQGTASLESGGVRVGDKVYQAKNTVIATGSHSTPLPGLPFDHSKVVDSTGALSFKVVPKKLLVIGGGVIGLELGSVWQRLGSKVTVVEALDSLIPTMDRQLGQGLLKALEKEGMKVLLKTRFEEATEKEYICREGEQIHKIVADKVLVSIGRQPHTKGLNLEALKVDCDPQGYIKVNSRGETSVPGIYAIGDVCPGPMLAHKAEEEGIMVAENLAGKVGHVNYSAIPSIVYTAPEVASIGMSEAECKSQGIPYRQGKFFFKANGRAKAMASTDGFVKVLSHKDTDRLLGVHMLGPYVSEIIAEVAIAVEFGASAEDLARSVHAHPTLAEVIKEAALACDGRSIHS